MALAGVESHGVANLVLVCRTEKDSVCDAEFSDSKAMIFLFGNEF